MSACYDKMWLTNDKLVMLDLRLSTNIPVLLNFCSVSVDLAEVKNKYFCHCIAFETWLALNFQYFW